MQEGPNAGDAGSITEVVGRFAARDPFTAAVRDLLAAGFAPSELSVLDTHESIGAAGPQGEAWKQALAGLVGEVNYVGPITAAGLIAIATGPIGAAIAGAVAAGLTGAALAELLDTVRATPHTESFARALEAGALLLWVRAEDPERQAEAREILTRHGAEDVHLHTRPPQD
ncbi:MAG: hypothetical protein ACE5GS_08345 [Kiloniellaceae bacterium]